MHFVYRRTGLAFSLGEAGLPVCLIAVLLFVKE